MTKQEYIYINKQHIQLNKLKKQQSMNQEILIPQKYYQNIFYPSMRFQCDLCKRDITKTTKILYQDLDYCISCFAKNINLHKNKYIYRIISHLQYQLLEQQWTARQQLLLFQGLQRFKFGNWWTIAEMLNGKDPLQIQTHYLNNYYQTYNHLPEFNLLQVNTKHKKQKKLSLRNQKDSSQNTTQQKINHTAIMPNTAATMMNPNESISMNNSTFKVSSNPAQIVGFYPKRAQFQVQYDNDAQLLLAQLQFNDDDSVEQKQAKFRIMEIYNKKLQERNRRKDFIIQRHLLEQKDNKNQKKSKAHKNIYNMMKPFAPLTSKQHYDRLVDGLYKEKQLRQRLENLRKIKQLGYKNLSEYQSFLINKNNQQKMQKQQSMYFLKKTRGVKIQSSKDPKLILQQEKQLCQKFEISQTLYKYVKQVILKDGVRQGIVQDKNGRNHRINERPIIDCIVEIPIGKNISK